MEFILFTLIILLLIYEFFKIIIPIKQKLLSQLNELRQKDQVISHSSKLAAIGELAAGVGHEINGPLTIIKGYLTRLKRESYKENKNEGNILNSFDKIEGSVSQIENVVKGLRTFARKDETKTVEFNLGQVVQDCISMVEQIYDHYGIKVTLSQSKGRVQIKVSDSGIGINDTIKKKVFEPYFTTKEFGKGSGLGLSLSFNFIKEHNGTIAIDSKPGHGTTFNIELPV